MLNNIVVFSVKTNYLNNNTISNPKYKKNKHGQANSPCFQIYTLGGSLITYHTV
jgi:hypothetical protein